MSHAQHQSTRQRPHLPLELLPDTLAEAGLSIFAISTFDTDYVLVKSRDLPAAMEALERAGHQVKR